MFIDVEVSFSSMSVTTHGSHDFCWQFLEAAQQAQNNLEVLKQGPTKPSHLWHHGTDCTRGIKA